MNFFAKKFYTKFIKISFISLAIFALSTPLFASKQSLQIIANEIVGNLEKEIDLLKQQQQTIATKVAQEELTFQKIEVLKKEIEQIKQQVTKKEKELQNLDVTHSKYKKTETELIELIKSQNKKEDEEKELRESFQDYEQKSTYYLLKQASPQTLATTPSLIPPEMTALTGIELRLKKLEYQKKSFQVTFQLLQNTEPDDEDQEEIIFGPEMWRDICLFSNPDATKIETLFGQINKTKTATGSFILATIMAHPTSDLQKLEQNKTVILTLRDDKNLQEQLKTELAKFKTSEDAYISFYAKLFLDNDKAQNVAQFNQLIQGASNKSILWRYLGSPFFCATGNSIKHLASALPMMAIMTLIYWGMGANISESFGSLASLETYKDAVTNAWFWGGFLFQQATTHLASKVGQAGTLLHPVGHIIAPMIARANPMQFSVVSTPCHWLLSFGSQIKDQLFHGGKVIKEITPYLQNTQALLQSLQQLNAIASQHTTLAPLTNDIKTFLNKKEEEDNELAKLLQLLEQKEITADQKRETFNAMINLMIVMTNPENNALFINALKAAGKIDAYLSLAELVKEDNEKQYCLVNYIDPQTYQNTHARFEVLWNPLQQDMDPFYSDMTKIPYQATTNYLQINQLQAVAAATVLAHLGIAPAQKAQITPLHYIGTSIAPMPTTGHETEKVKVIVTQAYKLPYDQHELIFIDNSRLQQITSEDIGNYSCYQALMQAISNQLLQSHGCCLVFAA